MKKTLLFVGAIAPGAAAVCTAFAPVAVAQDAPQQIMLMRIDPVNVATGDRASGGFLPQFKYATK